MTLNQILYFQKIANLENYHQAAEELYISQPSLSRSMASLENELGVTLFEKEGRGVTLTKAGKMFLEYADRILTDCHIAVGKMREISMNGGKIDKESNRFLCAAYLGGGGLFYTPVYINGKILTNVCGYATIHGDSKYIFERIKKEFK